LSKLHILKKNLLKHYLPFTIASTLAIIPAAQADSAVIPLGVLGGGDFFSSAWGVNADGSVVVGYSYSSSGTEAFRWTEAGMVGLGDLSGGNFGSTAWGVNADGSVVVGYSGGIIGDEAFRWTQAGGMVGLGYLNSDDDLSEAHAVSADGSVVVGFSGSYIGGEAFRWTEADGMVGLGAGSYARGVNADGSVVVGSAYLDNGYEAFRWTEAGGLVGLGYLAGGSFDSEARGVSADGSVVVGDGYSSSGPEAFRWTEAGGMVGLGDLSGGVFSSRVRGVNADGTVVVGESSSDNGSEGYRWTQDGGMVSIAQWLEMAGVSLGAVSLTGARAVNADGSVVVGKGDFGNGGREAYIARVGVNGGSGVTAISDIANSLNSSAESLASTVRSAGLIINGAHSDPLSRYVAAGRKTAWLAGDWSADEHDNRDGSSGLAEMGFGYNAGFAQMNLTLGKTWAEQNTFLNGETDADGHYIGVEGIFPLLSTPGVFATLGAYGHWGEVDIRRAYSNAGLRDSSTATPDSQTWGLRARIDWQNALSVSKTQLSPYVDVNYVDSQLDSYTETGGGFPAYFTSRKESISELRLGFNASYALSATSRLRGNLEAAHRFDDKGEGVSGNLVGLFAFDLEAREYDRNWFKAGAGIEGQVGGGKASLMLNGTTEGEMPNLWAAVAYQMTF